MVEWLGPQPKKWEAGTCNIKASLNIGDAPQRAERLPGDIARQGSGTTGKGDIPGGIESSRPADGRQSQRSRER